MLSHLFFAYNLMLFCEANSRQEEIVNDIQNTFCYYLGQKVNRNKSQVFFSPNVPDDLATVICRKVVFVRVKDLGMYLSMPLIHKKVSWSAPNKGWTKLNTDESVSLNGPYAAIRE
ncbi:hypothetical protein PVK06_026487 [Gossypium arboreum]|uniref:Uncharacterized protein n=1 Tax=Gossypium arboreum TaxID=29729 RepID=A0ABR0NZ36_GOSAR|nr:hypothetical protein PVK06_026487 [Gossypium arboreum]